MAVLYGEYVTVGQVLAESEWDEPLGMTRVDLPHPTDMLNKLIGAGFGRTQLPVGPCLWAFTHAE